MISFEVFTEGSGVSHGKFYQAAYNINVHTLEAAYSSHALMQPRKLIYIQETLLVFCLEFSICSIKAAHHFIGLGRVMHKAQFRM